MIGKGTIATCLVALLVGAMPAFAAEKDAAAGDLAREREAVRKATEELQKELRRNKEVVDAAIREMLKEARQNKDVLKEVFRDLGRNREELQATVKELASDPEIRKSLNELSDIIREAGKEFVEPSGKK